MELPPAFEYLTFRYFLHYLFLSFYFFFGVSSSSCELSLFSDFQVHKGIVIGTTSGTVLLFSIHGQYFRALRPVAVKGAGKGQGGLQGAHDCVSVVDISFDFQWVVVGHHSGKIILCISSLPSPSPLFH